MTRKGIKPESTAPEADARTTRPSELLTIMHEHRIHQLLCHANSTIAFTTASFIIMQCNYHNCHQCYNLFITLPLVAIKKKERLSQVLYDLEISFFFVVYCSRARF